MGDESSKDGPPSGSDPPPEAGREGGISEFVRRAVAAGMEAAGRSKEDFVRIATSEIRDWLDRLELDTELRKALSKMVLEVKAEIRFRPNEDGTVTSEATSSEIRVRNTSKS
jgi:hypothetical protein